MGPCGVAPPLFPGSRRLEPYPRHISADRSISETANSMDKSGFPERIRRRIPHRKDAVSALRRYVHNIRRYGYMEHLQPELLKPLPS